MLRKIFVLLLALAAAGCATDINTSKKPNEPNCSPNPLFIPAMAEITSSGSIIFSDEISKYYFNLPTESWLCELPSSSVINVFKDSNAQALSLAAKQQANNIQDILEIRLKFDGKQKFKDFVSEQCASQGLSYLFEVSETAEQKVYGCQINPQVKSAIMWRRTSEEKFIQIAYLPFYKPFVERLIKIN